MTLDEGSYYINFFCCNNLWKSKFMALEKPGKLRIFFFYFVANLKMCSAMKKCTIVICVIVIDNDASVCNYTYHTYLITQNLFLAGNILGTGLYCVTQRNSYYREHMGIQQRPI